MKTIGLLLGLALLVQCSGKKNIQQEIDLNSMWVLTNLTDFDTAFINKETPPTLEINLSNSSYKGHSGCNFYRGQMESSGDKITFSPAMSTKMACRDNGLENKLFNALHSTNRYKIDNTKLELYKDDKFLGVFQKAEEQQE